MIIYDDMTKQNLKKKHTATGFEYCAALFSPYEICCFAF